MHVKRLKWQKDGMVGYGPWKPAALTDEDVEVLKESAADLAENGFTYTVEEEQDGKAEVETRGPLPEFVKR